MNEEIEDLFPVKDEETEVLSVNTNAIVSEKIETIAVDKHGRVDAISIEYNGYRSELISFYKETTIENSIISTFSVEGSACNHTVILRETTGTEEIKSKKTFEYDDNFINTFLIPMIEDYNKENIVFNSTIEVLDEDKANFIARTKSNDSLIIVGISLELANCFKDIVTRNDVEINILNEQKMNEKGNGNYLVIILTIIAIGMCLVGTIIFSLIYYKS